MQIALTASRSEIVLVTCKTNEYNKQTKQCVDGINEDDSDPEISLFTQYTNFKTLQQTCPSNKDYCKMVESNDSQLNYVKGTCTPKLPNGSPCDDDYDCLSGYCINKLNSTNENQCA